MSNKLQYKRILLKLSGQALVGDKSFGIDSKVMEGLALELKELKELGIDIALVIGGGNIFRGITASNNAGMDRVAADYMGMLATVINGLALQDYLERLDVATRVMTAIEIRQLAEPYIRRKAIRHIEKGRIVIFVAGTGNPYFTTDTAAALRATEIGADVVFKATKVDGVYSADPVKDQNAIKYDKLSYIEVLKQRLNVMDATAVSMCMENNLPIIVFNLKTRGNIKKILYGENLGTIVKGE